MNQRVAWSRTGPPWGLDLERNGLADRGGVRPASKTHPPPVRSAVLRRCLLPACQTPSYEQRRSPPSSRWSMRPRARNLVVPTHPARPRRDGLLATAPSHQASACPLHSVPLTPAAHPFPRIRSCPTHSRPLPPSPRFLEHPSTTLPHPVHAAHSAEPPGDALQGRRPGGVPVIVQGAARGRRNDCVSWRGGEEKTCRASAPTRDRPPVRDPSRSPLQRRASSGR